MLLPIMAALAAYQLWRSGVALTDRLAERLRTDLPQRLGRWAPQLAAAAAATVPPKLDSYEWARVLAALMDRESRGGNLLRPQGPAGTGDYGHGRGLMQIDDRIHPEDIPDWARFRRDLVAGEDWKEPAKNILAGARHLRFHYDQVGGEMRRALAAYNAGPAVYDLHDPDALTTRHNYGADVLARAAAFDRSEEAA